MNMPQLNLPYADLKIKLVDGVSQVFDKVRKKYFVLTLEEWVRQHFLHFLHKYRKYPLGLMGVEKMVKYNNLRTRADIVIYDREGVPIMLVECKSPKTKINQDVFLQIAKYNFKLRVKYLVITNGLEHFCCFMDYKENKIDFLDSIPSF